MKSSPTQPLTNYGRIPLSPENSIDSIQARNLSQAIGLSTSIDKILFSISVTLTVILFGIIIWFWKKKSRVNKVFVIDENNEGQRSKKNLKKSDYPTITVVQKSGSDDGSVVESDVSSMWDTQSQKFDNTYFREVQLKRDIENCLSSSREYESAYKAHSTKPIDDDGETPNSENSTIEGAEEFAHPRKRLERDFHVYSKSDIGVCESRDDDEYGGAQSV